MAVVSIACVADEDGRAPLGFRTDDEVLPPPIQKVAAPLPAAHCQIMVDGVGLLDMEEEYLPRVIRCENGGANLEALKAQAIAARSVAYYAIETSGSICDSQGCQVYGCAGDPEPVHYQAVQETSGVYMMNNATLTYGFYVAGDNGVAPPACVGDVAVGTEHWVTYNEGRSGTEVIQTELGFVFDPQDAGYGQNRGCMSQWGARCLENDNGYDVFDIMRFYYGEDIELVQAPGECVMGGFDTGAAETTGVGTAGDDTAGGGLDTGAADSGPATDGGVDGGPADGSGEGGLDAGITGDGDGDDAADGAMPGIDGALPETFGGSSTPAGGCACSSRDLGGARWGWGWAWIGIVAGLSLRRRCR